MEHDKHHATSWNIMEHHHAIHLAKNRPEALTLGRILYSPQGTQGVRGTGLKFGSRFAEFWGFEALRSLCLHGFVWLVWPRGSCQMRRRTQQSQMCSPPLPQHGVAWHPGCRRAKVRVLHGPKDCSFLFGAGSWSSALFMAQDLRLRMLSLEACQGSKSESG